MKPNAQITLPIGQGGRPSTKTLLACALLCLGLSISASAQKPKSCGSDVTNLSVSVYKYTDATNTNTYNLQPDLTNTDGGPVPYVSGRVKGNTIDAKFQVDNCTYDFTLNLNSSNRFMTFKFPNGSPLGTSVNFGFFNIDRVADVPITDGGSAFLNWCNTATDNYAGCGVDTTGYFVRRAFGSTLDSQSRYHLRFNQSPMDGGTGLAVGTAFVKVYHTDATTWMLMPEVTAPPPGVVGSDGEWSALLDASIPAIVSYQKMPFKILVRKL